MEFVYFLPFCDFCAASLKPLEFHTLQSRLLLVNRLVSTSMHDLIDQYAFSLLGVVKIMHTPSCFLMLLYFCHNVACTSVSHVPSKAQYACTRGDILDQIKVYAHGFQLVLAILALHCRSQAEMQE